MSIFNGRNLSGWESNEETSGCFTVEDEALKVSGGRARLSDVGAVGSADFKNFGSCPYFKISRAVRFRKSELDAALERMRAG